METEYRKATAGTKVTCRLCNKKFYPDKLRVHRKFFCGAAAQLSEAQSKTQRKVSQDDIFWLSCDTIFLRPVFILYMYVCLYVQPCMYVYLYICIHIYVYTYINTYMYIYT
jgi:hypothetical protein